MSKQGHLSSVAAQNRLRMAEKTEAAQRDEDLKGLMLLQSGRRFVYDLLYARCRLTSSSFTGNNETFHLEGMRHVGINLLTDLQRVCPDEYVRMVEEAVQAFDARSKTDKAAKVATDEGEAS